MQSKIKVSFDADGTLLGAKAIREYAKELVESGLEVWICTRRFSNIESYSDLFCKVYGITNLKEQHQELFTVAKECGILPEYIHFMDMVDKYWFFKNNPDFLWHLDDDQFECDDINRLTRTVAISCANGSNWKSKCERLIKEKLNEKSI